MKYCDYETQGGERTHERVVIGYVCVCLCVFVCSYLCWLMTMKQKCNPETATP